jgi:hypothetical protein
MKPNIKKIIQKIKESKEPERKSMRIDIDYTKPYRERDMRQEAMDMGSHGSEVWGDHA